MGLGLGYGFGYGLELPKPLLCREESLEGALASRRSAMPAW